MFGNELGRLTQGMSGRSKGTNTLFFIDLHRGAKNGFLGTMLLEYDLLLIDRKPPGQTKTPPSQTASVWFWSLRPAITLGGVPPRRQGLSCKANPAGVLLGVSSQTDTVTEQTTDLARMHHTHGVDGPEGTV